jgi:putative transcriptional regulator
MKHDESFGEPAELAALYLAGALPPDKRTWFEKHLREPCASCRAEVEALSPAAAALAAAVKPLTPDPRTREALLARVAARPPAPARPWAEAELFIQRGATAAWEPTEVPGVVMRTLFVDRERNQLTALVRIEPGRSYPAHHHGGPEECLVLEGDLRVGETVLGPGDYQRATAGSRHGVQSTERGCLLLITASLANTFV